MSLTDNHYVYLLRCSRRGREGVQTVPEFQLTEGSCPGRLNACHVLVST